MASRFVPAAGFGLGGDWFDAFLLPDDSLGIVMGDVTGSGLAAAVVMGRLRSALRAYAIDAATPGEALDKLNRKFMHFEPGQMATVLYLTISPDRETVTIASAGHPPPIGAGPGEAPQFLACTPSPPIGVTFERPCVVTHAPLPPGSTLVCFTDGLYERRSEDIDDQLERLRVAVTADRPERVCSDVMGSMVGSHLVDDDTALLVLTRTQPAPVRGPSDPPLTAVTERVSSAARAARVRRRRGRSARSARAARISAALSSPAARQRW